MRDAVRAHYEGGARDGGDAAALVDRVDAALRGLGDGPLTPSRLAPLDQFHVGGLAATEALAALADVRPDGHVLDAGSGLGGPSRYLADAYGCRVLGVDLVPAYVEVARRLAARAGLGERVRYVVGDLTRLPTPDAAFDLAWTHHVVMNVRDRVGLYGEFRRVLRPGGALAFYDVLASNGHPSLHWPVPWAEDPATSTLLVAGETRAALRGAGFAVRAWRDVTTQAVEWLAPPPAPPRVADRAPAGGLATVMGPRFEAMAANLARNAREQRVRLVMGVCDAEGE